MNHTARTGSEQTTAIGFAAPYEKDDVTVIAATSTRRSARAPGNGADPLPVSHPMGAFVITDGTARWHPAVDVTRLLATAELVAGAVLVARVLARRPSGPKAQVTMGPGGWVSMKGGALGIRPARRPWGRPHPLQHVETSPRAPVWARVLSAVPLQALVNLKHKN